MEKRPTVTLGELAQVLAARVPGVIVRSRTGSDCDADKAYAPNESRRGPLAALAQLTRRAASRASRARRWCQPLRNCRNDPSMGEP